MNRVTARLLICCLFSILLVSLFVPGCSSSTSTQVITEEELEALREELAADRCWNNLDSLRFHIEGEICRASFEDEDIPPIEILVPDSVYRCPSTGYFYEIAESEETITLSCPAGHGSVTVIK